MNFVFKLTHLPPGDVVGVPGIRERSINRRHVYTKAGRDLSIAGMYTQKQAASARTAGPPALPCDICIQITILNTEFIIWNTEFINFDTNHEPPSTWARCAGLPRAASPARCCYCAAAGPPPSPPTRHARASGSPVSALGKRRRSAGRALWIIKSTFSIESQHSSTGNQYSSIGNQYSSIKST